jgi:hypothetical protein
MEIVENLEAALDQFRGIIDSLGEANEPKLKAAPWTLRSRTQT